MKVNTLEVVWHKKEAIHAFDTVGTDDENTVRVASGGVDCAVRIWLVRDGFESVVAHSEYNIRAHLFDTFWFTLRKFILFMTHSNCHPVRAFLIDRTDSKPL